MKADYTFEWYVQEIPPRCRKPRDVLHTKTVEVNIPEFRGVEVDKNAPVAIVVYKKDYGTNKKIGFWSAGRRSVEPDGCHYETCKKE